ncbi:Ig-like domain-containing protein [Flagellimonas iocasae]|uniref:Ig-like domain-containing protein n=1 Tax=Flagellimonas iocasae TaxID=2055905 RepID=A0ABW4XYE0_9FLAO
MKHFSPTLLLLLLIFTLFSCSSDSEDPTPEPDVIAPTVDFTIPGASGTGGSRPVVVSNQIQINIDAKDTEGIAKVEAFIDGQKVGEDTTAPYQITIDVSGYTSKMSQTAKFTDYVLKIVVTDTSGNTSSKEQVINIDNALPLITEVSLTNGQVIGGDTNPITFSAGDNEGLSGVNIYINDELISEIIDNVYQFNLNTLELADGENTMKIEATDLAENTTSHEVVFIADNTGPEIVANSVEEGQILDEEFIMSTTLSDTYSSVTMLIVTLGELNFFSAGVDFPAGTDGQVDFNLNPEDYYTGEQILKITAFDSLGNTSELEIPIIIMRKLITVNFPEQNVNPERISYYLFASKMSGELLAVQQVSPENSSATLRTAIDIGVNEDFMLTFADQISGRFGETNELTTIQNITRNSFKEINLGPRPQFRSQFNPVYPIQFGLDEAIWSDQGEFWTLSGGNSFDTAVFGQSHLLSSGNPAPNQITIERFQNISNNLQSQRVFLSLKDRNNGLSSYALINVEDLSNDFIIDASLFNTYDDGYREFFINDTGSGYPESAAAEIKIVGYLNQEDFENNIYHEMESIGYGPGLPQSMKFWAIDIFEKHRNTIRLSNTVIESIGEPQQSYSTLDWNVDFTFANNEFSIAANSNNEAILGQVFISDDIALHQGTGTFTVMNGREQTYKWSLIFDVNQQDNVILPSLPVELESWRFHENYQSQEHNEKQVEIRKYENLSSYDEYLNQIIKDNQYWYLVSPKKEIMYNSGATGAYNNPNHFILD